MDENSFVTSLSGVRVPRIIYGTAWKKTRTESLVSTALQNGFRGIDTACQPKHYHEPGVGAGVSAALRAGLISRAELYLQTKFTSLSGQDPDRIPYDPDAALAVQVAQSFAASLQNLQTDYLDCLVLHSPLPDIQQLLEVWGAMQEICDSGGARQIGISNCYNLEYLQLLFRKARIKPAVVQNRFYAETGYDRDLRQFCKQQGIIYQSFWTLTANPQVLSDRTVLKLATQYGRTPAQILFRYLTQENIVPLTGTQSPQHMQDDLEIFSFELNRAERDALTALF